MAWQGERVELEKELQAEATATAAKLHAEALADLEGRLATMTQETADVLQDPVRLGPL